MKYVDGFIDLEPVVCQKGMTAVMPGMVRIEKGSNVIEIGGRDYYAKRCWTDFYGELLAEEIAHEMNIPCAHYDVVYFLDTPYLVTEVKDIPNTYTLDEILSFVYQTENITYYLKEDYIINALNAYFPGLDQTKLKEQIIENKNDLARLIFMKKGDQLVRVNRYNDNKTYTVEEILKKVYHTDKTAAFNNIFDIKRALEIFFKGRKMDHIAQELNRIYLFDIIVANPDRNDTNLKVVDYGREIHFMPLYDNQNIFSHDDTTINSNYTLGVNHERTEDSDLKEFLVTYPYMIPILENHLMILNEHNIQSALYQVENKINAKIPVDIAKRYIRDAVMNSTAIYRAISEVKTKLKIK